MRGKKFEADTYKYMCVCIYIYLHYLEYWKIRNNLSVPQWETGKKKNYNASMIQKTVAI